ncbi:ATP synthase F0 subunit 8 (mitochondrion) [Fukomys damarensis]|uniref:ATP synthase complex subunit 8 n=2 Tax=Bathyergidae TaxID=10167 RepID=G5CPG9_HETGA|nr:ATP synthase F0 subunit 8 [Fukomys damarensis]AEM23556.1 ATP synthase F0 subunit 8 [Heterocephalus glaber]AKU70847.1 ATP synthase F0 subunit 8 [Fukomys damarensis]
MPQLDTSTWFMMITTMMITLFIMFQLKMLNYHYPNDIKTKSTLHTKRHAPWEKKWTKIYLPPSPHQH